MALRRSSPTRHRRLRARNRAEVVIVCGRWSPAGLQRLFCCARRQDRRQPTVVGGKYGQHWTTFAKPQAMRAARWMAISFPRFERLAGGAELLGNLFVTRQELATRNLSNRKPAHISRVTPPWVSAQAQVLLLSTYRCAPPGRTRRAPAQSCIRRSTATNLDGRFANPELHRQVVIAADHAGNPLEAALFVKPNRSRIIAMHHEHEPLGFALGGA